VCVQGVSPSRQCNYALPSPPTLLFSFCAQRASATPERKLTLLISYSDALVFYAVILSL
jgi:hypothetical protein